MKKIMALVALLAGLAATTAASAGIVIYDNTTSPTDFPYLANINGERVPSVDDLQVIGGGQLEEITFAAIAETLGGPADAHITLAIDNGDNIPDFGPGSFGSDGIVLEKTITGINGPFGFIPTGNSILIAVDVVGDNVVIPDNATVWAKLGFTRFGVSTDVGQAFYGPLGLGATDGLVYAAGPEGIAGEPAPDQDGFDGLGWKLTVIPEPATLSLFALGLLIRRRRRTI